MYELFGLKLELMSGEDKKRFDADSLNIASKLSTKYEGCLIGFLSRREGLVPVDGHVYCTPESYDKLFSFEKDFMNEVSKRKGAKYCENSRLNVMTRMLEFYGQVALRIQYNLSTFFVYNGLILKFVDFV